VNAPRALVYRALIDGRAVATWMVPTGMTSHVHTFDAREGGAFRISLTYDAPTAAGKTTSHTDTHHGHFVKLVPDQQVIQVVEFETTDPALQGAMTMSFTLVDTHDGTKGGTEIVAVHEGVPPGVPPADNEAGWRSSLANLAALVEADAARRPGAAPGRSSQKITPDDPRYAELQQKRFNKRFSGKPDYVRLVSSTVEVVEALQEAVRDKRRVVVRSGGHCLEGFVSDPAVQVVIDTSLMTALTYDAQMGAFAVEAGATLGEVYRKLFLGWGVTLPAGESPDIGMGGHVLGGAFGFLCRLHGLAADHLYAVEVVLVDQAGTVKSVVATCEASDPNRELWWAHTGGGGGNFGIVTRYWLRTPGAPGTDPTRLLPKAPLGVVTFMAQWDWKQIDEAAFGRLVRNYGQWCEQNGAADSPFAKLFSVFSFGRPPQGTIALRGVVAGAGANAERLLDQHLGAINQGVGVAHTRQLGGSSWLTFALNPWPDMFGIGPGGVAASGALFKIKDAFLRQRHSDRQIAVAYDYLTRRYPEAAGGAFNLATYGGQVNTVAPDATASAQRASIMTTAYTAGWGKPEDEAPNVRWVRELYRDLFAETGGVPVPGEASDGALINHPDVDLADPAWNRSGVDWGTLYYKQNYARLQRVKATWDPGDVFRHALSIRGAK
jgi:uncharacterized protein YndB with AHSA1/START domain